MVKQIVRDPFFLQQKSELATEADRQVVQDFPNISGLCEGLRQYYGIARFLRIYTM